MSLKPGIAIEMVLNLPSGRQRQLRSILYDGINDRLIIAQTSPPLLTSSKGETLQITYIAKKDGKMRRFGFSAVVSGFIKDYELSLGVRVPTLVLSMTSNPKEANVRRAFRVCPASDSGISLFVRGERCPICDVSLFGVSYIQPSCSHVMSTNDPVDGVLGIDGKKYAVKAKVVRVQDRRGSKLIALFFTEMAQALNDALNKKILMLQRKEMKRWF